VTGRGPALRLASALIGRACRRLPEGAREDRRREWEAELAAILDDRATRPPIRRYARAVRFAAGQRRAVRRLTRLTGVRRLRAVTVRAAVVAAAAAAVLFITAIALSPAASHAEYDSSPIVAADIWALFLAVWAALACTALVTGLGLASTVGWFWNRNRNRNRKRRRAGTGGRGARAGWGGAGHRLAQATRLAWRKARTARGAAAIFVTAVVCFTATLTATVVVPQLAPDEPSPGPLFGLLAFAGMVTGLACLTLLAGLAVTGTATWLWRLARHATRPPPRPKNHTGQQPG